MGTGFSKSATPFTDGIKDKVVVITGGGSGIGLGLAKAFVADGAKVVITGRDVTKLREAAKADEDNLIPFQCDVESDEDMIKLRDFLAEKGGADLLINSTLPGTPDVMSRQRFGFSLTHAVFSSCCRCWSCSLV